MTSNLLYESNESFAHKYAKEILCKWINDYQDFDCDGMIYRRDTGFDVYTEAPIVADHIDGIQRIVPREWLFEGAYDAEKLIGLGYTVLCVPDISIYYKGSLNFVIEIFYKHKVPDWKSEFYRRNGILWAEIDARCVLDRCIPAKSLQDVGLNLFHRMLR